MSLARLHLIFVVLSIAMAHAVLSPEPILQASIDDHETADASEFFGGSKARPKLSIISPLNGQVLDGCDCPIQLKITGYEVYFQDV